MQSLLYLITSTRSITNQDIIDILKISRSNNLKHNITGLLLYHEGSFLQILEGDKEAIHRLYFDNIWHDKRHKDLITIFDYEIAERSFSDWSMGFKQISKTNWLELDGYFDISNRQKLSDTISLGSEEVIALIKSYSDVNKLGL